MADPLKIKRPKGDYLTVKKTGARYDVAVTGGGSLTPDELQQVADYIGSDPIGHVTLEKLRARQ